MKKTTKKAKGPAAPEGKLEIEYVDLDELRRWSGNPKDHDIDLIEESMDVNGYVMPLLLDEGTRTVAAGHGRLEALERKRGRGDAPPDGIRVKEGKWSVPVIRGVRLKEPGKYLLADNRIVELGSWNNEKLVRLLAGYKDTETKLQGTGFTGRDFAHFVATERTGLDTKERRKIFEAAEVKQIVFYFGAAELPQVVTRFEKLLQKEKIETYAGGLSFLLDQEARS